MKRTLVIIQTDTRVAVRVHSNNTGAIEVIHVNGPPFNGWSVAHDQPVGDVVYMEAWMRAEPAVRDALLRNGRRAGRKRKFKGIGEDSRLLGVSRMHLWRVLVGQRRSKALMKRYRELKGGKA